MTDQKPNCGNCHLPKNMRSRYGMNCETLGETIDPDTVEKCGCLFHPDARAWLMRDVIKELYDRDWEHMGGTMISCREVIDLIKNGVNHD